MGSSNAAFGLDAVLTGAPNDICKTKVRYERCPDRRASVNPLCPLFAWTTPPLPDTIRPSAGQVTVKDLLRGQGLHWLCDGSRSSAHGNAVQVCIFAV